MSCTVDCSDTSNCSHKSSLVPHPRFSPPKPETFEECVARAVRTEEYTIAQPKFVGGVQQTVCPGVEMFPYVSRTEDVHASSMPLQTFLSLLPILRPSFHRLPFRLPCLERVLISGHRHSNMKENQMLDLPDGMFDSLTSLTTL